jgi:hypothetical protein
VIPEQKNNSTAINVYLMGQLKNNAAPSTAQSKTKNLPMTEREAPFVGLAPPLRTINPN